MAAGALLGLAGEGLGIGAFTAFGAAVVSLATVLVARFVLGATSTSASTIFFALLLVTAGAALAFLATAAFFGAGLVTSGLSSTSA